MKLCAQKHSVWNTARTHRCVVRQRVTRLLRSQKQLTLSSLFPVLTPSDSNTSSYLAFHQNWGMNTLCLLSPPTAHTQPTLALILPNQHLPPTSMSQNKGERTYEVLIFAFGASGFRGVYYLMIYLFACLTPIQTELGLSIQNITDRH